MFETDFTIVATTPRWISSLTPPNRCATTRNFSPQTTNVTSPGLVRPNTSNDLESDYSSDVLARFEIVVTLLYVIECVLLGDQVVNV